MLPGSRYGDLFQMSYVTRDRDAAVAYAEARLGFQDFRLSESQTEVLAGGRVQRLAIRAAMATVGGRQIEIIEPVSGPIEVYTEGVDLTARPLTFHHMAIAVRGGTQRWEHLMAELRAGGDEIAYLFPARPDAATKVRFCYVDTRAAFGHFTEYLWWDASLDGMPGFPVLD
ncbi:MAG: hypothetical protein ACTHLU_04660 [Novosphingobium sp.]